MRKIFFASAVALALCAPAEAATSTANMTISIQITSGCNVSVTNINFGPVSGSVLSTALTSTSAMGGLYSYTCSPGSNPPALTAGQGANFKNGSNQMKGASTSNLLPYTLTLPAIATFTGATQTAQITATIPAQTTLPTVDTYSDQVVLTLTY